MGKLRVKITSEGARYVDVAQLMKSDKTRRQLKRAVKLANRRSDDRKVQTDWERRPVREGVAGA